MGKRTILTTVGIAAFALVASACSIDIERNTDGSLQVDGAITEAGLAAELERDPLNENVTVDIQDGFVLVGADRLDPAGGTNAVAFRVEVGVDAGHLDVAVSDATFDGFPIPEPFVEHWNRDLARALERASERHPDATLLSVDVGGGELAFEWRIETPESRSG